jgi:hypothetical protein
MTKMTLDLIEETLRKEVRKLDKTVRVVAVEQGKKRDLYRVTLLKDGKSSSADLQKEVIAQSLAQEGKGKELKRALAKAVGHLSIRYVR